MSVHEPFKSRFLVSYSLWFSWTQIPLFFKARCCGGSSSRCRSQGVRGLVWCSNPLLFREKLHIVISLPLVRCHAGGLGSNKTTYLPLLPISMQLLFVLSCGIVALLVFWYFSERVVLYVLVILVCLWEEVISGTSYAVILNHPQMLV